MIPVVPQVLPESYRPELLLDAICDYAIYMMDRDGRVVSWNAGAEKVLGYRASEIIGQHFSRFFTPDDRARMVHESFLQTARSEGRHEAEGWRLRKDGSRFWCNGILQAIRDPDGKLLGYAKIIRDISERVAAQQALLDAERRFRVLVEGVVDYAIYMLDPNGVVTNWNVGAERLTGYTADEIVGQHFSRFYRKEERHLGMPARVLDVAAREGRYETEGWRVRKDGGRFWASIVIDAIRNKSGVLDGFGEVVRDVTERRAALDAVRDSERQFRLLVAGVTDYAIYMLDPNGIVTSWNAGARRIKGYQAEDVIGQHFSKFYTEQDRAAGLPARALYTASQDGRFEAEGWRVRKDGTMFWANVVISPIRDERNELIGFAKITRDITERRETQNALREAQEQRAHAQKMDALGKLTGGVAHDFNNLLMVVSGHVPTLRKIADGDPRGTRAVNAIEAAAQRGASLTRQLLTFSRRQVFNPIVCQVDERIEAFRIMLAGSIGAKYYLITSVEPGLAAVKIDPNEFELAIVNLVLNARDAMPDGGTIAISAETVELVRRDTQAGLEGAFVAVRVTDNGFGIAPDVLPKVFDPFFTTKRVDKGSGLGLSQVHGFAHQSGGTVSIESQLGTGTTVTLYLPRAEAVAAGAAPEPDDASGDGGRVLVVEDNPDVAEATVSMLQELGYDVQSVGGADAGLEEIRRSDFALVVSDIVMPGSMDGLTLARAIRKEKPGQPVLLVTGYSQAAAEASGEFTVMRKPFQLVELSRAAARVIAESRQPETTNVVRLHAGRRGNGGGDKTD